MWAYVEDNTIIQTNVSQTRLIVRGSPFPVKYAREYTIEQKEAYGVYEVADDTTNYKDPAYYTNGAESMAFSGGVVTRSWAVSAARNLDDTVVDGIVKKGLKSLHKGTIKGQARSLIKPYDWYYIRKADAGTAVSSSITNFRAAVRTQSGTMETAIDNAANVDALAALYVYTGDPLTRPLGEWPKISDY